MKKIILSIIIVIILTTVFTACNTQENTQETINQQTDIQSSETIANKTPSQEQAQTKTYIGEWKYTFLNFGNEIDTVLSINEDGTFTIICNEDWETYGSNKIKSQSGIYIEESDNKIKLSIEKTEIYNPNTEESIIETMPSDNTSSDNVMYCTVQDSNTLILETGDETTEITRIN